jgi:polysaccharide export outer membrane protein
MKYGLLFVFAIVALASCNINRNLMFKTDHDYVFDVPADSAKIAEYRISPNDILSMRLFANKAAKLLDITAGTREAQQFVNLPNINFFVEPDGTVELPELGFIYLQGYTIREAEAHLESLYSSLYRDPFVLLRVTNNRVLVFPGSGGEAEVVILENNNVTLLEALALAGGIAQRGDARKVKLIRQVGDRKEIYQMNLATIEGVQAASIIVQANDVIYVDPIPQLPAEVLQDVAPVITLITSLALIYAIFAGIF